MIIRSEQMEVFRAKGVRDFQARLCEHLRQRDLPGVKEMPAAELHRRAGICIKRAQRHKLDAEWAVAAFAALMFRISARFDEQPAIAEVLRDERIEPNERMNAITTRVTAGQWQQAAEISGDSVWAAPGKH